ncbi:MAG: pyridoxal-dependent decarboxylase [Clostridiales bacterium]|nr:pyridoxal-dependent decarboxylase [Clostridiales bacterium]
MTTPEPVAVDQLDYETLNRIGDNYGESFYLLDTDQYAANFQELHQAFASRYPKFAIAYSYKTNYIPAICKRLHQLGGYAEVVSRMEWEIARRCGVPADKMIFNGPFKHADAVEGLLVSGGVVNIDSLDELPMLEEISRRNPAARLHMGIRVNFDIGDGVISRFGVDADSDLPQVLDFIAAHENMELTSLQCHFATRRLDTWAPRAQGMLNLIDKYALKPKMVDLGGGLFGKMHDSLKAQFSSPIPTYEEYAEAAATLFAAHYANVSEAEKPLLLIEPGSALSGDVMRFCCKVKTIKQVRGHAIATVLGSVYNINPTLNGKNPPLEVFHCGANTTDYQDVNVGGFTCIESDYLYKGYQGPLAQGDYLVFGNVGSYSVVLKPPFILPNFAVVDKAGGVTRQVKRPEDFDDLFATYAF